MQVQGKEKQVILWVVKLKTILPFSYILYKSFQYSTKQNNYCQNQFQKSKYKTSNMLKKLNTLYIWSENLKTNRQGPTQAGTILFPAISAN